MEWSVCRADGVSAEELWGVCTKYVDKIEEGKIARARAIFHASRCFDHGLQFDPDGVPHRRHANVIGWPPKHELKNLQQKLAPLMDLELRPN